MITPLRVFADVQYPPVSADVEVTRLLFEKQHPWLQHGPFARVRLKLNPTTNAFAKQLQSN